MIHVVLPYHLQVLAKVENNITLALTTPATIGDVLHAIETKYPTLRGTIVDHHTKQRRPLIRFFICSEDWSLKPLNTELPEAIISGAEPFYIVGAIAGG